MGKLRVISVASDPRETEARRPEEPAEGHAKVQAEPVTQSTAALHLPALGAVMLGAFCGHRRGEWQVLGTLWDSSLLSRPAGCTQPCPASASPNKAFLFSLRSLLRGWNGASRDRATFQKPQPEFSHLLRAQPTLTF